MGRYDEDERTADQPELARFHVRRSPVMHRQSDAVRDEFPTPAFKKKFLDELNRPENDNLLKTWRVFYKKVGQEFNLQEEDASLALVAGLERYVSTTSDDTGTSQNEAKQGARRVKSLIASVNRTLDKLLDHYPLLDDPKQDMRFFSVVQDSKDQLIELVTVSRQQDQAYRKRASLKSKQRNEEALVRFCSGILQLTGHQHYKHVEQLIDLAYAAKGIKPESKKEAEDRRVGDRVRHIVARFREAHPARYRKICKDIGLPAPPLPDTRTEEEKAEDERIADALRRFLRTPNAVREH